LLFTLAHIFSKIYMTPVSHNTQRYISYPDFKVLIGLCNCKLDLSILRDFNNYIYIGLCLLKMSFVITCSLSKWKDCIYTEVSHIETWKSFFFILFILFLSVPGFERRALCLVGRPSTTWVTYPILYPFLKYDFAFKPRLAWTTIFMFIFPA
jgi:hypothetical protein